MATKYANGHVLYSLTRMQNGLYTSLNVHVNGHILIKKMYGWRQWAIVPKDSIGNVVDWLIDQGFKVN